MSFLGENLRTFINMNECFLRSEKLILRSIQPLCMFKSVQKVILIIEDKLFLTNILNFLSVSFMLLQIAVSRR